MDQENNGDGNGEGDDAGTMAAIESLDDYIRRYGLRHGNGDEQAGGEFNGMNQAEAHERVRAEEAYRDKVIEKHQQEAPQQKGKNDTPRLDEESDAARPLEGAVVTVLLADMSPRPVSLQPLFAFSDTVKRMVTSRLKYGARYGIVGDTGKDAAEASANQNVSQGMDGESCTSPMELSLVEFDADAVLQFMDLLISLHDNQQSIDSKTEDQSEAGSTMSRKRRMNDDTDEVMNKHIMNLINEGKISDQNIVECVKIAHYLQCRLILEALSSVMQLSIDSQNCMAICSLADALGLKSLFEASVNYVIERLDAYQGTTSPDNSEGIAQASRASSRTSSTLSASNDGDGEEESMEEIWASVPYELRSRVLTMRNVMRSSVIGRGSKVSGLFFSSGNEFLAIFRELLGDQKERLSDAKERREEVIRERSEEWLVISQRRGRWFDAGAEAKKNFVYGADVAYALGKIEKQSKRLATLESFYEEQKTIFKDSGFTSEIRL